MPIHDIKTHSLDEFWDYINPIGDFINSFKEPIFRGQGDANWSLTPSVLRTEVVEKFRGLNRKHTEIDQIIFIEYCLLSSFLYHLDQKGLMVPGDSKQFRNAINFDNFTDRFAIDGSEWPCEEFYPLIALAQHNGIPTRLMDWTKKPIVGAYFAASQVTQLNYTPSEFAVWVMDLADLEHFNGQLEYLSLPGNVSHNLAAQDGVFIIHRRPNGMTRYDSFSPANIKNQLNNLIQDTASSTVYKIHLPGNLSGHLIKRCEKFGISAATLFPGYNGAAKAAVDFVSGKRVSGIL